MGTSWGPNYLYSMDRLGDFMNLIKAAPEP